MSSPERTIVIGGGIAGLLAARRHALAGRQVTLLEADEVTGGAIAAQTVGGIEINTGAEAWSVGNGSVEALVAELGMADRVVSPVTGRGSRLVSAAGVHIAPPGGMFGIPARPLSPQTRQVLGTMGSLRAWAERFLPAGFALREGVTIGDYVRRRMGRRVVDRLVAPLVGGVHSADPYSLELAATLPRLPDAVRETGSLAAAVRSLRPDTTRSSGRGAGTAVRALTPTMADLTRALEAQLRERGAEVLTSTAALSVTCGEGGIAQEDGGTWQVTASTRATDAPDGPAEGSTTEGSTAAHLEAEHLVLACPPDATAALLEQVAPDLAAAIPSAPAVPVRLVALVLEAPALDAAPSGTGALVAAGTPGVRAKALTHATAKWEHVRRAADGLHVVRLSYGRPGEELPEDDSHGPHGTEGAIVDLALTDASAILGTDLDRTQLRAGRVITWQRAMRRPGPGHREALARITELLAPDPRLELVGSWRAGTGIDAIVRADARAAAEAAPPNPQPEPTPSTDPTQEDRS